MNAGEGVEKKGTPLHCWWEQSLLKLMSIESVMPSTHLILCRPLLLPPSIFPSIRVFPSESVFRIRWPKNWSFSFSIRPSNEYSGLTSFRMDCALYIYIKKNIYIYMLYYIYVYVCVFVCVL